MNKSLFIVLSIFFTISIFASCCKKKQNLPFNQTKSTSIVFSDEEVSGYKVIQEDGKFKAIYVEKQD